MTNAELTDSLKKLHGRDPNQLIVLGELAAKRIDKQEFDIDHFRSILESSVVQVEKLTKENERAEKSFRKISDKLEHVISENATLSDERDTFTFAIRSMNRIIGKLFHVDDGED